MELAKQWERHKRAGGASVYEEWAKAIRENEGFVFLFYLFSISILFSILFSIFLFILIIVAIWRTRTMSMPRSCKCRNYAGDMCVYSSSSL